jgi:hypothetical protein
MSLSTEIGIRRPDHTGSNRCWPCTVVNVVLVAVGAAAVAVAGWPGVGVGLAVGGLALVWLRGYVVPGTPRFAPRLVAPIPGSDALFHGSDGGVATPDGGGSLDPDEIEGEELLDRLIESGVLELDGDTVVPTAEYDERWRAEIDELRDLDTETLAEMARELSPATASQVRRDGDDEWVALSAADANVMDETWVRRQVAIAEIAGYRATEPFLDDDAVRLAAARTNRMFLDACPDCGTGLERGTDMSCCGGHTGPGEEPPETLICPACEVRLYTFGHA